MADIPYSRSRDQWGNDNLTSDDQERSISVRNVVHLTGGIISLALVCGITIWGYNLIQRDVSGIPVVRKVEGDMRIRPEEPGGQLALNQGLAVNAIAASGSAEGPVDQLVLAPKPYSLADEDQPSAQFTAEREENLTVEQPEPIDVAAALQAGQINQLVREIAEDSDTVEASPLAEEATSSEPETLVQNAVFEGPGLTASLRPQLRPNTSSVATAIQAAVRSTQSTAQAVREVDAATLPAGTRLVQLGAFNTPDIAREQWDTLNQRFGDYLRGKGRVIQEAQSGGRTFYRLRAAGFDNLSDARRFCSALVSEGADCIPVVTR